MADTKVSALPALGAGDLDPINDFIMVGDASVGQSKRMAPVEMIRASLPFLSSFYDFTTGVQPAGVSFTAASTRWRTNSAGVLVPATTDAPRFQYDPTTLVARGLLIEEAATNSIRNSTMQGAVTGTPGTPPTNWGFGALAGLSSQIVGFGQLNGIDYIDVRYFGTTNTTGGYLAVFDTSSAIASANGQTWTQSVYLALVAGTFAGITTITLNMVTYPGGGSAISTPVLGSINGTLKQLSTTAAIADVSNTNIQPRIAFNCTNGAAVDFTLRIGLPQLVRASMISSPIPTTSTAATRARDIALISNPQVLADQVYILRGRTPRGNSNVAVAFQVDDGTSSNRRSIRYGTDGKMHVIASVGGASQCDLDMGAVANDTDFVIAARFADSKFAASLNGGAIVTAGSGFNPLGLTTARVGDGANLTPWNSTIRTIETRRTATDAELPLLAA